MNTTSVSENSNEILEIKWEEIEKLPLKDQSEYYNSLAKKIIATPINNPEEVSLDGRKYVIDEKFKEILKLCCEFADYEFESIEKMLRSNSFYAETYFKK